MRRFQNRRGTRGESSKRSDPSGKMTRAQAISTFGVGSIFELRYSEAGDQILNSVMIAGLDEWPEGLERIEEVNLARSLGVKHFFSPPRTPADRRDPSEAESLPAYRFPSWMVCSQCQALGTVTGPNAHFDDRRSRKPRCIRQGCDGHGVPARLVTSCFSSESSQGEEAAEGGHPGHISEFPWSWWAHSLRAEGECEKPRLKLLSTGDSAGLSGLVVSCSNCPASRTLEGVFSAGALSNRRCFGDRPWLGDEEGCDRPLRVLMRGASNIYFPVVASAISIPPNCGELRELLEGDPNIKESLDDPGRLRDAVGLFMARSKVKRNYSESQVQAAIESLKEATVSAPMSQLEQKAAERNALLAGTSENDDIKRFEVEPIASERFCGRHKENFSNLAQVKRLREVRALRGFSRITPAVGADIYSVECAPLSRGSVDWLPAMVVSGEGIYFELNYDNVFFWSQRKSVQKRHRRLEKRWAAAGRNREPCPNPGFILLHSLTHAIMNRLAMDCGYSSASLRERIYVSEQGAGWFGALIYTAVPGADGTLGGLVSQGAPTSFFSCVEGALEESLWCSSDPLCIDLEGQGADALNQAACHACVITSETSCEFGNALLDRAYLCGTDDEPDLSFFNVREFGD